jgi:hypothetical protein
VRATEQDVVPGVAGDSTGTLVRLVTRLILAQAAAAAAIGLFFSRRHLPSLVITVLVVVALCVLAAVARTGTHAAWVAMLSAEAGYVLVGLFRFMTGWFIGGTLFAIIAAGVLIHPTVARAYGSGPRPAGDGLAEPDPGDGELRQA